MKVAVVNVNKSRINRNHEYHLFTIKAFIDERSGGQIETEIHGRLYQVLVVHKAQGEVLYFS